MTILKYHPNRSDADVFDRQNSSTRLSKRFVSLTRRSAAVEEDTEKQRLLKRCDSLERQRDASNLQVNALREDLQKRTEDFQQFTSAVSHDLQTPLRAVLGFGQFLEQEYRDQLDETAVGYIDRVVEGAGRMEQLLKGLVGYSRVISKAAPFEIVNLDDVLKEALEKHKYAISDAGALVTAGPLPTVFGDPNQLLLMFYNLIDNSLKFRSDSPLVIHVSAEQFNQNWNVSVGDNGIGIAQDRQECVFTMFRRLHLQQEYEGVGAGLAICRRIIDRHSGQIWVESKPEQGCTFSFSIPLSAAKC